MKGYKGYTKKEPGKEAHADEVACIATTIEKVARKLRENLCRLRAEGLSQVCARTGVRNRVNTLFTLIYSASHIRVARIFAMAVRS